jgi:hypothetical protein
LLARLINDADLVDTHLIGNEGPRVALFVVQKSVPRAEWVGARLVV